MVCLFYNSGRVSGKNFRSEFLGPGGLILRACNGRLKLINFKMMQNVMFR